MTDFIGIVIVAFLVLFFVLPTIVGLGIALLGLIGAPVAAMFRFFNPR